MLNVVLFVLILGILVFVHELGHFLFAKRAGVRVDEFGLGFPPRIFGKKIKGTIYSINAIPLGGFVKIFGEDQPEKPVEAANDSFISKPKSIQAAILAAGIFFNLLFAWLLLSAGFIYGLPTPYDESLKDKMSEPKLLITGVLPNSPAEKSGLKAGDEILFAENNGKTVQNIDAETVSRFIASAEGKPVQILYKRGGENGTVSVEPVSGLVPGKQAIGIAMDKIATLKLPPRLAVVQGARATYVMSENVVTGLVGFFGNVFVGKANLSSVSGPVGIAGMVGDAEKLGIPYLILFTAFISINLAALNVVPFPALDGGRLLFVLIEKIRGKPIKPKIANALNFLGFALLLLLMIVVTYHDIAKLL